MKRSNELSSKEINLFTILTILLLFLPKITIYKFPGYWQGIRLEEIVLFVFLYIAFKKNIKLSLDNIGKPFLIFFLYFFLSSFVGYLNNIETNLIFYLRYIEYVILLFMINTIKIEKDLFIYIFKACIVINLIFAIMQLQGIVGVFSSKGYFDHLPNSLPYGIFGGSWELSMCVVLSYFIVINLSKDRFSKIFFLIPVMFILIKSQSMGITIGFIASFILFLLFEDKKLLLLLSLFGCLLFFILNSMSLLNEEQFNKLPSIINLDFKFIFKSFYSFIVLSEPTLVSEIPKLNNGQPNWDYLSLIFRIDFWIPLYERYLTNIFTIFFGHGFGDNIYLESLILRVIFSFGILGTFLVIYTARKLPIYLFVLLFLSGFTLDLFVSFKIFIFTTFLIYSHKKFINQ
jgi:hypothetical protein